MFRQIVQDIPGGAEVLFRLHPIELTALLEQAWTFQRFASPQDLGHPHRRSDIPGLPDYLLGGFPGFTTNAVYFRKKIDNQCDDGCIQWDHLIYAYMVENTRVIEIFRRVLQKFREGEELGVPLVGTEHWLRNTEELFFRSPAPFSIYALNSMVRPDTDAIRRNAYFRMFGMELNHGSGDSKSYPFVRPTASNTDFVNTFEEFLRAVWIGIVHQNNMSGPRYTDDSEIANLAEKLHDMLITRRKSGNLAREEFYAVSMMSWFHLTLDYDSPIVLSLRAEGASPEQRLFKIAERVGLPAHAKSKSFFDIANDISLLLILIELGLFNPIGNVEALYNPAFTSVTGVPSTMVDTMRTIINYWSIASGREMKSSKVSPS